MSKYDIAIIDSQYLLRRNWSMIKNQGPVNKNMLIKSFLQSVMKLKREMDFDRPLLLFDKYPYYKQLEAVEEYKQDRYYVSDSDADAIKKKLEDETLTEEERAALEADLERILREISDSKAFTDAKYDIINNGRDIGFNCLLKQGFEADDIAFGIAEKIREINSSKPKEEHLKAVLVTTDRDWVCYRSPEVDYMTPKQDHRNAECREIVLLSRKLNIPMYEIGVMKEVYKHSHNNVQGYEFSEKVDFETFAKKLFLGETDLPGYDKVEKTYKAMNIRKHLPELEKMLFLSLTPIEIDYTKWYEYTSSRDISISLARYSEYTKGLKRGYI